MPVSPLENPSLHLSNILLFTVALDASRGCCGVCVCVGGVRHVFLLTGSGSKATNIVFGTARSQVRMNLVSAPSPNKTCPRQDLLRQGGGRIIRAQHDAPHDVVSEALAVNRLDFCCSRVSADISLHSDYTRDSGALSA